jgi:chromosome segregation ATPase
MKNVGLILVGGVTVPILLLVAIYLLWPTDAQPQSTFVIAIDQDIAQVKDQLAQQEAPLQTRLDELRQQIDAQQTGFEEQTRAWETELSDAQQQLEALQNNSAALQIEINWLSITRTNQYSAVDAQLQQSRQAYLAEQSQLQAELTQKQADLEALNAQLNRP